MTSERRARRTAPKLLPIQEAAIEFEISLVTLYRHIAAGRLMRYRRGIGDKRTYVDRDEIKRLQEPRPVPGKSKGKGRR